MIRRPVIIALLLTLSAPASALEPPPPEESGVRLTTGLDTGVLVRPVTARTDASGTNALVLGVDWDDGHWGFGLALGIPVPAPIAGTGIHLPIDVRYFPQGNARGFFLIGGIRGVATLADVCYTGDVCGDPEPSWRPTTFGALGRLGVGFQGDINPWLGWRAHLSYMAGPLAGSRLGDVGPVPLTGLYQGGALGLELRFGL